MDEFGHDAFHLEAAEEAEERIKLMQGEISLVYERLIIFLIRNFLC